MAAAAARVTEGAVPREAGADAPQTDAQVRCSMVESNSRPAFGQHQKEILLSPSALCGCSRLPRAGVATVLLYADVACRQCGCSHVT